MRFTLPQSALATLARCVGFGPILLIGCSLIGCSASTSPPPGGSVNASQPSDEGGGDDEASANEPESTTTPGGVMVDENGQTTVVDENGMEVVVDVVVNDDGTTTLVDEEGNVILVTTTQDDILAGPGASGAPGCGDGTLTEDEACDDGNTAGSDGCAGDCLTINSGYSCVVAGEPCRPIARCGDGLVAASEQCDDGNAEIGDGCTERCKVELGKKCEGEPSMCSDAECGNGMREGAEACDDGNAEPFDGCSALCLREPDCAGASCTSECGDGLLINEDCDDGNTTDGDGCSSTCALEQGFTCTQETVCEMLDGECILRVPAIFRDFTEAHPDFGFGVGECSSEEAVTGLAAGVLDDQSKPVAGREAAIACITSADTFGGWFRNTTDSTPYVGDILLFDNGNGGYVNRFGTQGDGLTADTFIAIVAGPGGETYLNGTCEDGCAEITRNSLRCEDVCRPLHEEARQLSDNELIQAQNRLTQAENAAEPDEDLIAEIEAEIADIELQIEEAELAATTCDTDCETDFDTQVAACVADCKPCSTSATQNCVGGEYVEYDGNPLFFPLDGVPGVGATDLGPAKVPEQYGYNGWPWEEDVFGTARDHNFYFTTEVVYWFRYDEGTNATLDFTGDDDVWVYVNGRLAVDLGGIHIPLDGTVTINAQTADDFGLEPGNVYKITVFQAERKMEGSSFRLTLSGFEATPSDCSAVCGDGVLSFGEECDDGTNDGGYGECAAGCLLGEFCGDGVVNGPEDCDNGPGGGEGCPNCRELMAR